MYLLTIVKALSKINESIFLEGCLTNLKTLALSLNLSQATVSRALNGYDSVKPATRIRVMQAAQAMNYRPNTNAQRLATGRAGAVGVIITAGDAMLIDPHFTEFLAGLTRTLSKKDTDIVLTAASLEDQTAAYTRFARTGKVDGFIVSAPKKTDPRIKALLKMGFPFVVHGQCELSEQYSYYDIDNQGAFDAAASLLIDLGHRKIALLNGTSDAMFAVQRNAGFRQSHLRQNLLLCPEFIVQDVMSEDVGYQRLKRMLEAPVAPTAVICSSMTLVMGALRAIHEMGLVVGKDISVISHDDALSAIKTENFAVPLTVTRAPIRDAGAELAKMLDAVISSGNTKKIQTVAPVDLVVRASTAPPPTK